MRGAGVMTVLAAFCLPGAALAGEVTSWTGEAGAPAPLAGRYVMSVKSQKVQITLLTPQPHELAEAVVRTEYVLEEKGPKARRVAVGFAVCYERIPTGEEGWCGPPAPRAYVKLDGRPVEVRFVTYRELAQPRVEEWQDEIERLLDRVPGLSAEVGRLREEAKRQPEGWLDEDGVALLAAWLLQKEGEENLSVYDARWVAGGLLGVRPRSAASQAERALRWLDPNREKVDLYEELSEEWGHEELLLEVGTGQLVDTRSITWEHVFGAFVFEIEVEPGREHRLVVQHRQPLGYIDMMGAVGLRYVLTRAERWGGFFAPTLEVRVPEEWKPVGLRPPAMETGREEGFTVYRIRLKERPVEELYVSAVPRGRR